MQISRRLKLANLLILLTLSACGAHLSHVVERGETLYSISWMYGYDYQKVAQWNGIKPPYVIKPGERLRLQPSQNDDSAASEWSRNQAKVVASADWHDRSKREPIGKKPVTATATLSDKSSHTRSNNSLSQKRQLQESIQQHRVLKGSAYLKWQWPTRGGRLVSKFEASDPGKRGLDIAGSTGQAVMAAADGEVVYSGGGLPHYGKLIIVKHNDVYLSAYAHNRKLYVAEGDAVRRGQHIADMGSTGSSSTRLHFEIRRNGKPIDPLQLLPHIHL